LNWIQTRQILDIPASMPPPGGCTIMCLLVRGRGQHTVRCSTTNGQQSVNCIRRRETEAAASGESQQAV
jgi:hypothetical protein